MKLTRAQLLSKYDIRPKTLDVILGSGLIEGEFENSHGRRTLEVTPHNSLVLESSRNDIQSFGRGTVQRGKVRGVHAMPFHRFLILRFLTTPLSEIHDEIFQLNLLHNKSRFPSKTLKKIHTRFLERLPKALVATIKARKPPTKKLKESYDTFLRAMNLKEFYEDPEIVDRLNFFMDMKPDLEMYLSTRASSKEVANVVSSQIGINVAEAAIWVYRVLFYSIHEITDDDFELYLSLIKPHERSMKKIAIPKDITELAVSLGLDVMNETRDVLVEIRRSAQREFFDLFDQKTAESRQARKHALDQFLKADEYIEKHGGNLVDFSKIFGKFVIEKAPSKVISIEDIRSEQATGTDSD